MAQEMIDLIAQLYVLEAGLGSDSDERKVIRQEKSKCIVDDPGLAAIAARATEVFPGQGDHVHEQALAGTDTLPRRPAR